MSTILQQEQLYKAYLEAIAGSAALHTQLVLVQSMFPSSTNDDRIRNVSRIHEELVAAWRDIAAQLVKGGTAG